MPKNAVQRLQKIENDLKTVISIYEVSSKCKSVYGSETHDCKELLANNTLSSGVKEPETSQTDVSRKATGYQPSQDVYSNESEHSLNNLKLKKLTVCEVSNEAENYEFSEKQNPVRDTDANFSSSKVTALKNTKLLPRAKKSKGKKESTARRNSLVPSKERVRLEEYPEWLTNPTSNWFGSIKQLEHLNVSALEEKSTRSHEVGEDGNDFSDANGEKIKRNGDSWTEEFSKMIEKTNEKLKKMKVSKELALDIAKHLKEKYDEIQQSKQELMEKLTKVQEDSERHKNELREAEAIVKELQDFAAKQMEESVKNKEKLEQNVRKLKARICELKEEHREELLEIEKIQRVRLAEIRNESENKENQAKEIQRLSQEKRHLLAINDQLSIMLNDRYLEKQYLEQKIRHLEEEVLGEKHRLKIKTKELEDTNTELKSIRQNSADLQHQVQSLRRTLEETQNDFLNRTEDYEQRVKINQQQMNKLLDENITLKSELENEKDALLIKTKIIEDQQETIKQLKEKAEEAKTLMREKESLERILNTEREEKLELEEAVERLKRRKEELKQKIKILESDLLAPEKVAEDLQKTQTVLHELENQVYNKQKEWQLQLCSLIREKEQACSVAEYATKKLIQTSNEFQKQSEEHKKLRRILAENFTGKENVCWREQQEP